MVEMHGGSVQVESEVGKGSRFTVSLPWRVDEEKYRDNRQGEAGTKRPGNWREQDQGSEAQKDRRPVTILLAEDNEANINTVSEYLTIKATRWSPRETGWRRLSEPGRPGRP